MPKALALVALLKTLSRYQKELDFLSLFKSPFAPIIGLGIALHALEHSVLGQDPKPIWTIVALAQIQALGGGTIALFYNVDWFLDKIRENQKATYFAQGLQVGAIALVEIGSLRYLWAWANSDALVFQVSTNDLSDARRGMRALRGMLGILTTDFKIPPTFEVNGFVPATPRHQNLRFTGKAKFTHGASDAQIVSRFHTSLEQTKRAVTTELARLVKSTLEATPMSELHNKPAELEGATISLEDLQVEVTIEMACYFVNSRRASQRRPH